MAIVTILCCWLVLADAQASEARPEPAARPVSQALRWFRTSAEMRAVYRQVYALARERVGQAAGEHPRGSWAVVMDADETILDNSEYRLRLVRTQAAADWAAWAREQRGVALPGSVEFVRTVHSLGGRVIVVTNRNVRVCDATRANLEAVGVAVDAILCAADGVMDKNPRFRAVRQGTAGLPPLEILAFVGDNIRDFPDRSQSHPQPDEAFGQSLFVLPNPMYGSWEENEVR